MRKLSGGDVMRHLPHFIASNDIVDVQRTALLLFAGYLDTATQMSESCGGGGSTPDGWGRDKDEDNLEWARRCARMANRMCKAPVQKGLKR